MYPHVCTGFSFKAVRQFENHIQQSITFREILSHSSVIQSFQNTNKLKKLNAKADPVSGQTQTPKWTMCTVLCTQASHLRCRWRTGAPHHLGASRPNTPYQETEMEWNKQKTRFFAAQSWDVRKALFLPDFEDFLKGIPFRLWELGFSKLFI